MYDHVRTGLQKTKDAVPTLRAFKRAAMVGVVLPTGPALDTYLPTFLYISAVSLLDDALETFIDINYPGVSIGNLGPRIDFLNANGRLKHAPRLHAIREARNRYAHEGGQYASWDDLEKLFNDLDQELTHLGVV